MEDISRELERELKTHHKPAPYKRTQKKRIIVVDDFGNMRSGQWIKTINWFLLGISMIFILSTGILYYLYAELKSESAVVKSQVRTMENRIDFLTDEKELLLAKLVILDKKAGGTGVIDTIDPPTPTVNPDGDTAASEPDQPATAAAGETGTDLAENPVANPAAADESTPDMPVAEAIEKTVSIEKFKVFKDGQNNDLLVRFDIRNVSDQPGDVAGYIFTVLRNESDDTNQWLVVPTSPLEDGVPQAYKKGQYFSIAHYKPVKFRIKNQSSPDFFTKASIYVFNTEGELIFEKLIDITEAE